MQAGVSEHALQQASYELAAGLRVAAGQSSQYSFSSAPAAHAPGGGGGLAGGGEGDETMRDAFCEDAKMVVFATPETVTSEEGSADVLNMRHGSGFFDHTVKRTQVVIAAHASQQAGYVWALDRMGACTQSSQNWLL